MKFYNKFILQNRKCANTLQYDYFKNSRFIFVVYLNFRVDSYVLQKKKKILNRESYFLQI